MILAAARLGDPIAHNVVSPFLKRVGFTAGVVVEVLLIVGTGGGKKAVQIGGKELAQKFLTEVVEKEGKIVLKSSKLGGIGKLLCDIADVMDGAVIGHWLGGLLGSGIDYLLGSWGKMEAGKITTGAKRTFIEGKPAARMRDKVECAGSTTMLETVTMGLTGAALPQAFNAINNLIKGETSATAHVGMDVAQGSISVYIESWPASRVGDATKCDAIISKGASKVGIGGVRITDPESVSRYEEGDGVKNALYLLSFNWLLSIPGGLLKGLDKWLIQGKSFWSSGDTWSSFLKSIGVVYEPAKDILSMVDRSQKIVRSIKDKEAFLKTVKGIETTTGKVLKNVDQDKSMKWSSEGGYRLFETGRVDADGNPVTFKIMNNGDVVVSPDVTNADVLRAQKQMEREALAREIETRRAEQERYNPPPRHPGYRR